MGTSFERKDFWDRLGGRYVVDQAASGHDEWIFCQVIYFFLYFYETKIKSINYKTQKKKKWDDNKKNTSQYAPDSGPPK